MGPCFVRSAVRWSAPLLLAVAAPGALAQVVTPKTLPVHQDDQFSIFPSSRAGMAGLGIALDDTLGDPFVNPARATRLASSLVFGMPYVHDISDDRGGGRTIPLGTMWTSGRWAGTAVFALQQLDRAGPAQFAPLSDRTAVNQYLSGSVARRLAGGVSIGASAYWASVGAIDGVDLLYAGSDTIRQEGDLLDFRLGLSKSWADGGELDLVATHSRTDMTHDVHFTTVTWGPWTWTPQSPVPPQPTITTRREQNLDRTRIWSGHARFHRPMGHEGWRLGWTGTYSQLSHPKIPNYEIMNVPRDPGTTHAFNIGMGISHTEGPVQFGADVVLEPMFSETWADAARDTTTATGGVIPKGGKTVENDFEFSNAIVRLGIGRQPVRPDSGVSLGFQAGIGVRSISYRLHQVNNVLGTDRRQREHWMEWIPTFSLRFRSRAYDVEYAFRMTCGPSSCDDDDDMVIIVDSPRPGSGGIIAAPSRPIDIRSGTATMHRLAVVVPIR